MQVKHKKILIILMSLGLSILLNACSTEGTPSSQAEYENVKPLPSSELIVPPGLKAPKTDGTYKMLYPEATKDTYQLGTITDMHIVAGGTERWLVINNKTVNQVFPIVEAFLNSQHIHTKYQNPNIGLIQTDWVDRNLAEHTGKMHEFLGWIGLVKDIKVLPSLYTFRVNIWQNGDNVDLFVTDYQINQTSSSKPQTPVWVSIPPDPQVELDFLTQFMAFVNYGPGVVLPTNKATQENLALLKNQAARAKLDGDTLIIYDNFDQAWWRTSIALERIGLGIFSKNHSTGEFYVFALQSDITNTDPGSFKRLFGDDTNNVSVPKPKYTVKLSTLGTKTYLTMKLYPGVVDLDFANSTQKRYLAGLFQQLK